MVNKLKTELVYLYVKSGMCLGAYPIFNCDDETVTLLLKNGTIAKFSRKTGKQINSRKPGYRMFIADEPFQKGGYKIVL